MTVTCGCKRFGEAGLGLRNTHHSYQQTSLATWNIFQAINHRETCIPGLNPARTCPRPLPLSQLLTSYLISVLFHAKYILTKLAPIQHRLDWCSLLSSVMDVEGGHSSAIFVFLLAGLILYALLKSERAEPNVSFFASVQSVAC